MTVPARRIVGVNPGVISGNGSAFALTLLVLTSNPLLAAGIAKTFSSQADVGAFFSQGSDEYRLAGKYFGGISQRSTKPGQIIFVYYNSTPFAAKLFGASLAGLTLSQLQALTPSTISLTVNGTLKTSTSIDLSAAASFSAAAATIQAAFTAGPTVTYDGIQGRFIFTSPTTGSASTITVASTSTMATGLNLTAAAGATVAQGGNAEVPAAAMDAVVLLTQAWASFTTVFEPSLSDKQAFATWSSNQNFAYNYIGWDSDQTPVNTAYTTGATSTFGAWLKTNSIDGAIAIGGDTTLCTANDIADLGFFYAGIWASLNFAQTNGRVTAAGAKQSGMVVTVADDTKYQNMLSNGYSMYTIFGTKANTSAQFQDGALAGVFKWSDSFYNQMWLNDQLQVAELQFIEDNNAAPYNDDGYTLLRTYYADPIRRALNFGVIRPGVTLSESELAQVFEQAGLDISNTLQTYGYYLQILDPGTDVRIARGSPDTTLWYCDGQAIQRLQMNSTDVL